MCRSFTWAPRVQRHGLRDIEFDTFSLETPLYPAPSYHYLMTSQTELEVGVGARATVKGQNSLAPTVRDNGSPNLLNAQGDIAEN